VSVYILRQDAQSTFEAKGLWVAFTVNPSSTREYQRSRIAKETERLKEKQEAKILLAVFSMNPREDGPGSGSGQVSKES